MLIHVIVQEFPCLGLRDAIEFSLAHFASNCNLLLRQSSSGRRKSGHCPMRVVHRKTAITCNQQPIAADVPAIILGIKKLRPGRDHWAKYILEWKDGCLFEVAERTPSCTYPTRDMRGHAHISRVRWAWGRHAIYVRWRRPANMCCRWQKIVDK